MVSGRIIKKFMGGPETQSYVFCWPPINFLPLAAPPDPLKSDVSGGPFQLSGGEASTGPPVIRPLNTAYLYWKQTVKHHETVQQQEIVL